MQAPEPQDFLDAPLEITPSDLTQLGLEIETPATPPSPATPAIPVPVRRRKKVLKNITKQDIRRLGRRAGIKRLNRDVAEEARLALIEFLTRIVKDATTYTEHASRKTVIRNDVVYALKKNGHTLYQ